MQAIAEALEHTPWWVFLVFFYVLFVGIRGLRTGIVALWKLAFLPAIFAIWGLFSLFDVFGPAPLAISVFTVALALGGLAGWRLSGLGDVRAAGPGQIEISGSPVTLLLVLSIFASKYALGYWLAVESSARHSLTFEIIDASVAGIVIGVFLGRSVGWYQRYKSSLTPAVTGN